MHPQQLKDVLRDKLGVIKYNYKGVICSNFVTYNLNCMHLEEDENIVVFNLILENYELIKVPNILCVSAGSLHVPSALLSSFTKSKEKFKLLTLKVCLLNLDWNIILAELVDHVEMVFRNDISVDLFLSFLETKTQLLGTSANLLDIVKSVPDTSLLQFILCQLFDRNTLTFDQFKADYINLINKRVAKEILDIENEWSFVTSDFPETHAEELADIKAVLNKVGNLVSSRFERIREGKIRQNWNKLIKISYNCWPAILQPNPFKHLVGL